MPTVLSTLKKHKKHKKHKKKRSIPRECECHEPVVKRSLVDPFIHSIHEAIKEIDLYGFAVVRNVLSNELIQHVRNEFFSWKATLPWNYDRNSKHSIIKQYEVGNQRFAWLIRTNPRILQIFRTIWQCTDLVTSMDGCGYMARDLRTVDKPSTEWTHVDQTMPCTTKCIQGWAALTSNIERTLLVYRRSHLQYRQYFESRGIKHSTKNWLKIDRDYLKEIEGDRVKVQVEAGDFVLWDSKTFHRNSYGERGNGEERLVQFVCMFPKHDVRNTVSMQKKRKKYFYTRRSTSHWPYPIKVNAQQPQTYGDHSLLVKYENLQPPHLDDLMPQIQELL
jgi:hypothetical protein